MRDEPRESLSRPSLPWRGGLGRRAGSQSPKDVPYRKYVKSIDALRALGVIAVIGYHLNLTFDQGGLLGVTIFFVISGYLITGILVDQMNKKGTIDFKNFWLKRIRRLFPAICCVVVCTIILCILFNHQLLTKLRPDIAPSLFWFQNWWYILRDLSYFDALGDPSPLVHFWSLAIEEQFYLCWPIIIFMFYRTGGDNITVRHACLVFSVLSVMAMMVLYDPQADPTRVYYGTDTRAFSLLIGGWLAIAWPWKRLYFGLDAARRDEAQGDIPAGALRIPRFLTACKLDIASTVSFVAIVLVMVFINGTSSAMYHGVILLVSILTAVMIAAAVVPESLTARIMEWEPFSWIGIRSYGMYLWHYPLILLLKPLGFHDGHYEWYVIVAVFVLTFLLAHLQYTYVEDPIRKNGFFVTVGTWMYSAKRGLLSPVQRVVPVFCSLALVFCIVGCAVVPDETAVPEGAIVSTGDSVDHAMQVESAQDEDALIEEVVIVAEEQERANSRQLLAGAYQRGLRAPVLVGDSVPAALLDYESVFPYGLNDSVVSRATYQANQVLAEYVAQGIVGDVVVVACFSNHPLESDDLSNLLATVGTERQLFLVTCRTPDPDVLANNDEMRAFAEAHGNVHVIDWYAYSAGQDDFFYDDGIHLTPDGRTAYDSMLQVELSSYLDDIAAGRTTVEAVLAESPDAPSQAAAE